MHVDHLRVDYLAPDLIRSGESTMIESSELVFRKKKDINSREVEVIWKEKDVLWKKLPIIGDLSLEQVSLEIETIM